jgi:dTDP-4-dehydrorhamnose reductase
VTEAVKLLIFGASGMLGHKLYQVAEECRFEVFACIRQPLDAFAKFNVFNRERTYDNVDIRVDSDIQRVLVKTQPDVVVNCAGLVKPRSNDESETILVNSLFPHRLAQICALSRARMIQISTDCVFSGSRGQYSESSIPDPVDLYGRTKLLGEVTHGGNLTVRTSMMGRELGARRNLIEWFLSQTGEVRGFTGAIFSGLTTRALSRIILKLASNDASGLIHVGADAISKYDLLRLVKRSFGLENISVVPSADEKIDRSLACPRLGEMGITAPSMQEMVDEMAREDVFYRRASQH